MATWTDVERVAAALPLTRAADGARSWRLDATLLAWERPLRKSDLAALGAAAPAGPILGVRVPLDAKELLLASAPTWCFTTPHFHGYPAILVHLPKIRVPTLRRLLTDACASAAATPPRPRRAAPTRPGARTRTRRAGR